MLAYGPFVGELTALVRASAEEPGRIDVGPMLDGRAAADLRRLVSLADRRSIGAFFTPEPLAERLAEPFEDEVGACVVVDPACGAGDLLLASARRLLRRAPVAVQTFVGVDVVPEFVAASELRLNLLVQSLSRAGHPVPARKQLICMDGRASPALGEATHIVLNPPFTMVHAPSGCEWSSGVVNAAAPFLLDCIDGAQPGTRVRAILPDVLRSGTRYRRWRARVGAVAEVVAVEAVGRFDRWTDVDVFLLDVVVGSATPGSADWAEAASGQTVADHFSVSVGPVVHNRDPLRGAWRPYLTSKRFPSWSTIDRVAANRRFLGRLVEGPFVVIPRTSRPSEPHRARGAVVSDPRPVAVDNHLIIVRPLDGGRATCDALLPVLRHPATSEWLNDRIRCRHLTTGSVGGIPWSQL